MPQILVTIPGDMLEAIHSTGNTVDSLVQRALAKMLGTRQPLPKLQPKLDKRTLRIHYSHEWWDERREQIQRMHAEGKTLYAIARELGVGPNTVLGNVYKRGIIKR